MSDIRVKVTRYADRPFWVMYYDDPRSGRRIARSTKQEDRREAERTAAKWEAELQAGRYKAAPTLTWEQFRCRVEEEHLDGLSHCYWRNMTTAFNRFESLCKPKRLADVTPAKLRHFAAELKAEGKPTTTIESYLRHLGAALQWAVDEELLAEVPKLPRRRRGKAAKSRKSKGRPIMLEEFERMLAKCEAVRGPIAGPTWQHFLEGLWLSGLRLGESLDLYWDRDDKIRVDFSRRFPMLAIPGSLQKSGKTQRYPITPDFADFLQQTPEGCRGGRVFRPLYKSGKRIMTRENDVSAIVSDIGKAAGVKVNPSDARKVKFASAHDLRRSFGTRWAPRMMPVDLQKLMRHENINTTTEYYVDLDPEGLAERLWAGVNKTSTLAEKHPVFPRKKAK